MIQRGRAGMARASSPASRRQASIPSPRHPAARREQKLHNVEVPLLSGRGALTSACAVRWGGAACAHLGREVEARCAFDLAGEGGVQQGVVTGTH